MQIKKKIEALQRQGLDNNCYYLINSKDMQETIEKCKNDEEKLEYFYNLCANWDNSEQAIPLEIGLYIEELIENPSIQLGIHRSSNVTGIDDKNLVKIMQEGLENNAQLSQGVVHDIPGLTKTVSIVNNMFHTIPMLKSGYKGSNGSIIFAFPKEYLDVDGNVLVGFEDKVYEVKNGTYYIKPEYIVGYLVAEYGVYNIYTKEDIIENIRK